MLSRLPMAHDQPELPLQCVRCGSVGARLAISSLTVITVRCAACAHQWSVEIAALSADARKQLAAALLASRAS